VPVFRVLASRTEFYAIEACFRAATREEAESAFYAALEAGAGALDWNHDFDGSDTEIDSVEDVTEIHEPSPSGMDRRVCRLCGRAVRWTGVAAEQSPTGQLVPGPWVHIAGSPLDEGVGL
jgi:hypothetical protein